jgi:hypothetical protein
MGSMVYLGSKEDLAYNGQIVFEEKIIQLLTNLHNRYPNVKKIALAGGVFANVKLNKRINEQYWVDEVFIAPPMGATYPTGGGNGLHITPSQNLINSDAHGLKDTTSGNLPVDFVLVSANSIAVSNPDVDGVDNIIEPGIIDSVHVLIARAYEFAITFAVFCSVFGIGLSKYAPITVVNGPHSAGILLYHHF